MRLRTWYRIHKWVAVAMATAVFLWLITGLVMILPESDFARDGGRLPPVDFASQRIPPAEATARFQATAGDSVEIREVALVRIIDRLAYRITPRHGAVRLVDAATGADVKITAERAGEIARASTGTKPEVERVERITEHSGSYPVGQLPMFRVWFPQSRSVMVSPIDGAVAGRRSAGDRFRFFTERLHAFAPLRLGPGGELTQLSALWAFSLGSLFVALTGVYLALPKRWKVGRSPHQKRG